MVKICIYAYFLLLITLLLKCQLDKINALNEKVSSKRLLTNLGNSNNSTNPTLEEVKIRRKKVEILETFFLPNLESKWQSMINKSLLLNHKMNFNFFHNTGKLIILYHTNCTIMNMHYCSTGSLRIALNDGFYDDTTIEMVIEFNHDKIELNNSFLNLFCTNCDYPVFYFNNFKFEYVENCTIDINILIELNQMESTLKLNSTNCNFAIKSLLSEQYLEKKKQSINIILYLFMLIILEIQAIVFNLLEIYNVYKEKESNLSGFSLFLIFTSYDQFLFINLIWVAKNLINFRIYYLLFLSLFNNALSILFTQIFSFNIGRGINLSGPIESQERLDNERKLCFSYSSRLVLAASIVSILRITGYFPDEIFYLISFFIWIPQLVQNYFKRIWRFPSIYFLISQSILLEFLLYHYLGNSNNFYNMSPKYLIFQLQLITMIITIMFLVLMQNTYIRKKIEIILRIKPFYYKKSIDEIQEDHINFSDLECVICLDLLQKSPLDKYFMETPCGHQFHVKCLSSWLSQKETCPKCRRVIPKINKENYD